MNKIIIALLAVIISSPVFDLSPYPGSGSSQRGGRSSHGGGGSRTQSFKRSGSSRGRTQFKQTRSKPRTTQSGRPQRTTRRPTTRTRKTVSKSVTRKTGKGSKRTKKQVRKPTRKKTTTRTKKSKSLTKKYTTKKKSHVKKTTTKSVKKPPMHIRTHYPPFHKPDVLYSGDRDYDHDYGNGVAGGTSQLPPTQEEIEKVKEKGVVTVPDSHDWFGIDEDWFKGVNDWLKGIKLPKSKGTDAYGPGGVLG